MIGLTVAVAARASAPLCRRVHQQGLRARLSATRPRQVATTTAIVQRLTSTSSNSGRGSRSSGGRGSIPLAPGASILLAAALLCSPSAQPPAEASWWPFSRQTTSPLEETVPRKAKRQRARAEREMREYLAKMRVPIQELIAGLRKGEVSQPQLVLWLRTCEVVGVSLALLSSSCQVAAQRLASQLRMSSCHLSSPHSSRASFPVACR